MASQFIFNNKKSYDDFNLTVVDVEVGYPSVNVISQSIPYMNGTYDFSSLYGGQTYSNRTITIKAAVNDLVDLSRTRLSMTYVNIVNWLFNSGIALLKIDFNEYLFSGRVVNVSTLEDFLSSAAITISFDCYPFRVSEKYEGDDIWDVFNFELDYAQDTKFSVTNSRNIVVYNPSATRITPAVICSDNFTIIKNNTTYNFNAGTTTDFRFSLDIEQNDLTLVGNGTIEFKFKKEVM